MTIRATTYNMLGKLLNDPFEFAGNYGLSVDAIREIVFALCMTPEALTKARRNLAGDRITAIQNSLSLRDIIGPEDEFCKFLERFASSSYSRIGDWGEELREQIGEGVIKELQQFLDWGTWVKDKLARPVFELFRSNPSGLLALDKELQETFTEFNFPILGSKELLRGNSFDELRENLAQRIFQQDVLEIASKPEVLKKALKSLEKLGDDVLCGGFSKKELEVFASSIGLMLFYWMYQCVNLYLVANDNLIDGVNQVKKVFAQTIGNKEAKMDALRKLLAENDVIFTQEADPDSVAALEDIHPINGQDAGDGTLVLLRKDKWEDVRPVNSSYCKPDRLNMVLAKNIETGERFLLASCHASAKKGSQDDKIAQIEAILSAFQELKTQHPDLQLLIGADMNTKKPEEVDPFVEYLLLQGLTTTHAGNTTVKQRMLTAQHEKAGETVVTEEDFIITLDVLQNKPSQIPKALFKLEYEPLTAQEVIPNKNNLSDHYPVSVVLTKVDTVAKRVFQPPSSEYVASGVRETSVLNTSSKERSSEAENNSTSYGLYQFGEYVLSCIASIWKGVQESLAWLYNQLIGAR